MRQKLAHERYKRGWTQRVVAEKMDISEVYVRKLEKGVANPGRETMVRFEQLYGVSVYELFDDIFRNNQSRERNDLF
ncbi:helix-turn-helix transcriptional regulator [Bacillaceae bacterium SIJ1]|uniref:helix-turn-helix domain-containing protein n=1 Tax=Litoribacterium kuwaitense TaxID=1398745 RepID=UPI0013EA1533|nr:helix-turn-helix transcriptional regulator [Litoribacterium kuwaitense]NGP45392.1 helix-turn-helix transcriptional regulator [Litoribacterium kuwaitense]